MATTDHLLISSISHNSQWWSITAAENLSGQWIAAQTYLPIAEEETEVLQRGEVISSASRHRQEKNKMSPFGQYCIISNAATAF